MTMYFERTGTKTRQSLLFVHGAGSSHEVFSTVIRELQEFDCIAIDLPQHGRSKGDYAISVAEYANVTERFAASLEDTTDLVLVGHSMGGAVGIELACRESDVFKKMIWINSSPCLIRTMPDFQSFLEDLEEERTFTPWFIEKGFGRDASEVLKQAFARTLNPAVAEIAYHDFSIASTFDRREDLENITLPCMAIAGSDDQIACDFNEWMQEKIQHLRFETIQGGGHFLPIEKPKEVVELLRSFLK